MRITLQGHCRACPGCFSGGFFLPFPYSVLNPRGVTLVVCFSKAKGGKALMGAWSGGRKGGTGTSSPPSLQLHNLSGSSCYRAGACGSSLHLVTTPLSSGTSTALPSALRSCHLPVFAISSFLTAPWLASWFFHP